MHPRFFNLSIFLALASGAASVGASPSAQEVWQRHVDGIGGVEACAVDSLHASGRYILPAAGLEGTVDVYLQRPDKLLFRVEFANGVTASGTDGVIAWRVEPQKPARLLGDDERRGLAKWLARGFSIAPDPDAVRGVGTAGVVDLEGRKALRATMEVLTTGDTYTELYDPETGLLLARMEPGPPGTGTELKGTPSDYREFDGLLVATTWEHELAGQAWSAVYETVELNVEIDPEIFAPPPELRTGNSGPGARMERVPRSSEGLDPAAVSASPSVATVDRNAGWRSDLDFLVSEARRLHAGPTRPALSPRFQNAEEALRAAIPDLSDDQILARMMKLVAILNDGHSGIYGPGSDSRLEFDRRVLPFKFYLFPSGLYIVDGDGEWVDFAGSRVIRFGALSAQEVLRRLSVYRGVDNEMTWNWMGPQFYVRQLGLLREVGVNAVRGSVELTLVTLEGERRTLTVDGGDHELVRKLRTFPASHGEAPLYLSRVDTYFWMKSMPEHGAIYFQFNHVRDAGTETIESFSANLRQALFDEDASTLIVDVRHNNGGNGALVRPLVRVLIEFEMRSPEHRIFVLMGRNTFSAAQNFINRVERWTDAVFVGEPSSSSPNFVGEENPIVLPFSRVRGSLSNLYWQDSDPWDERPWIAPDLSVELTAKDYFEGIDPVLERVWEQIQSKDG